MKQNQKKQKRDFHLGKPDPNCEVHHYRMPDGHCSCAPSVAGEVRAFLSALGSDDNIDAIGSVGKFRCKKKLSDGSIVTFSFSEPLHG